MTETATTGADVREAFKPLTEAAIRAHTDDTSHDRGAAYYHDGYISDTTIRGPVLRAFCQGSSGGPYQVEATLQAAGAPGAEPLAGWRCSCPRGGFFKHVVALLLTWVHRPAAFAVRPELAELLAAKSREELLDLVGLMVQRYPDLADPVELAPTAPRAAPGLAGKRTVEPARIKGQVANIFRESRYDRYDDYAYKGGKRMILPYSEPGYHQREKIVAEELEKWDKQWPKRKGEVILVNDWMVRAVPRGGVLRIRDEWSHAEWKVWRRDFKRYRLHLCFLRDLPLETNDL